MPATRHDYNEEARTRAMDDSEKQRRAVREQVARVMRQAQGIAGGREKLAARLNVEPHLVAEWIACLSDAPPEILEAAVEVILELRSLPAAEPQPKRKADNQ